MPNIGRPLAIAAALFWFPATASLIAFLAASAPAAANEAAGSACAARLPPPARLIYADTAPDIGKRESLRDLLTEHVRPMVAANKIDRATARASAQAAGACLEALRR